VAKFGPERVGTIATVVLALCAVVLTLSSIRREFLAREPATAIDSTRVRDWRSFAFGGQSIGPASAPVTIVEFADFECPYCARLHRDLVALRLRRENAVRVVFRHFPLPALHRFANLAAHGSECAASQGRFESFATLLFQYQDSIGVVPWTRFAADAGVEDTAEFASCIASRQFEGRLNEDRKAGERLVVRGTPTFLVNDLRVTGYVGRDVLEDIVTNAFSAAQR
jgi:protein-disulfide isomerase